jgi:hypothetical protein
MADDTCSQSDADALLRMDKIPAHQDVVGFLT